MGFSAVDSCIVAEGDSAHFLIASFAFLLLVCTVSGVGDERGGREFGSTRVSSAIFPAFGLLTCNMILHGLGISWVKDGSFDDGSNLGLEMAMHPSVRGFATPLLLVPLASLPWICTCTLSPAQSTRGLRIAVAISLIAVGLRNLALGSGVDAFVRITGWDVEDTLSTFAAENLPGPYPCLLATQSVSTWSVAFLRPVGRHPFTRHVVGCDASHRHALRRVVRYSVY